MNGGALKQKLNIVIYKYGVCISARKNHKLRWSFRRWKEIGAEVKPNSNTHACPKHQLGYLNYRSSKQKEKEKTATTKYTSAQ